MEQEFKAVWRFAKMSSSKVRPVIDAIRGQNVNDARAILESTPRRAASLIKKVLESAVANAVYESQRKSQNIVPDRLSVVRAFVDRGPLIKRWRATARGRAHPYRKYHCHITVVVAQKETEEKVKRVAKKMKEGAIKEEEAKKEESKERGK
jgi:large subunit ribosomal protein L22